MRNIILIASTKAPDEQTWLEFRNEITRACTESYALTVHTICLMDGPGCANLAIEVTGTEENIEAAANALTMALFPARWTFATDDQLIEGYHLTR